MINTFDQLVSSGVLPLPILPAATGMHVNPADNPAQQYARRCHDLRKAVRQMSEGKAGRALEWDEMVFWNKLCT